MLTAEQYRQKIESLFKQFNQINIDRFIKLFSDIATDEKTYLSINQKNLELLDKFTSTLVENKNSLRFTRTVIYKLICVSDPDINDSFDDVQYLISSLDTTKADFEEKLDYYENILFILESLYSFTNKINELSKIKSNYDFDFELSLYSKFKYLEQTNSSLKNLSISNELFELFVDMKFKYVVLLEEINSLIAVKDDILKLKSKVEGV